MNDSSHQGGPELAEAPPSTNGQARVHVWDVSARGGFGSVFTAGLSYLGAGFGGAVGYHATKNLRLELSALYSAGNSVRASNEALTYRSSSTSTHAALGAGYDFGMGPVTLRPSVRAGARLVQGRVIVGSLGSREEALYPIVGPCLAIVVRIHAVQFGVDGEAFYLPMWPGAPSAGLYGFVGTTF